MRSHGLAVVWYRLRATFRRRWRGYVAIVFLIGLVGGVAMGAIAAGRRTQSSFPRFLARTNASDLGAEYAYANFANSYIPATAATIGRLPQVVRTRTFVSLNAGIIQSGTFSNQYGLIGSVDGSLFTSDRFTVTQGRMADPARADEVVVNKIAAKVLHLRVGQVARFAISDASNHPHSEVDLKVVGIGVQNFEVVTDDVDQGGSLVASPALTRTLLDCCVNNTWMLLRLRHGAKDIPAVEREVVGALPQDSTYQFHDVSLVAAQAERALRPQSIALGAFGIIAAAVALTIGAQAIARQLRGDRADRDVLRALGATPGVATGDSLVGAIGAVVLGALAAAGVAVLLSPLAPVGPVRAVERARTVALDWTVLGCGVAVLVVVLVGVSLAVAVREAPHRLARRTTEPDHLAGTASVAASSGLPAPAVTGIRFAVDRGDVRGAGSGRPIIAGATMAILTTVATITFGSGLSHLVSHPPLYGWNWDEALTSAQGYGPIPAQGQRLLDQSPAVASWTGVFFAPLNLAGIAVPGMAGSLRGSPGPPILSGHGLESDDQIVLGPSTLHRLHKRVGDTVDASFGNSADPTLSRPPTRLRIVGTATMPALGASDTIHPSMGTGALVSTGFLPDAVVSAYPPYSGPNAIFVRFRAGTTRAGGLRALQSIADRLNAVFATDPNFAGAPVIALVSVQRPAEIVNYRSMGATPAVLASVLAVGAVIALALTLMSSVRRRRRDLAVLKTLGFVRRQLAATVAWQASVAAGAGVVVGVPAGVALGRWLWIVFAQEIFAVPRPVIPALPVALVAVAALVLANLVAALPGLSAARTPTATVLRTE